MDVLLRQGVHISIGLAVMFTLAQISPQTLRSWTPWLYAIGIGLLIAVFFYGDVGKGAQRWLKIGGMRFQPSEFMKIALPLMVARYLGDRGIPPSWPNLIVAATLIVIPIAMIFMQPDLGTAVLIGASGLFVIFLAGISWRVLGGLALAGAAAAPVLWFFLHDYQRRRILTLLDPERDPLGAGWHIIQSKVAIGSGGLYGKGWLNGTQSQLEFLPERSTDFIFAVIGEEFGLMGLLLLLGLYLYVIARGLQIAAGGQDIYSRLVAGSLSLIFFMYIFVNTAMVIGLIPVVGIPLPLISYGGTSIVTLLAGFGIIMSVQTHRKMFRHEGF